MIAGHGDDLPVSAMPLDGTYPSGTSRWEKRNISDIVPVWRPDICIQCGNCAMVCPHAVIRARYYDASALAGAPDGFASAPLAGRGFPNLRFTLQIGVEDCTGCELCVEACPARSLEAAGTRAINMEAKAPLVERERRNLAFFETLPDNKPAGVDATLVRGVQYLTPLFEYSGRVRRMRGNAVPPAPHPALWRPPAGGQCDRLLVHLRRQSADDAVVGQRPGPRARVGQFSLRRQRRVRAGVSAVARQTPRAGGRAVAGARTRSSATARVQRDCSSALQVTQDDVDAQRSRVADLERALDGLADPRARQLRTLASHLVRKSVWIVGGDGWAYDIGYGGLDHVLASGRNVNLLVLDTEVYSNTGGQASKATPRAGVAKFAAGGKRSRKKDLGLMAVAYGDVYVAQIAMGASAQQTLDAFLEAEAHPGPSLIIAYSHCIAHGINMRFGMRQQKLAVDSGHWPLYRYRPAAQPARLRSSSLIRRRRPFP